MKPKTKLEKEVTEISAKLRPITEKQLQWGEDCIPNFARIYKGQSHCLECGHSWKPEDSELSMSTIGLDCPECGKHLQVKARYSTDCAVSEYFQVWQVVSGFQVIRTIFIKKIYHLSRPACVFTSEVMQHWINETGKVVWLSKNVHGLSRYYDQWVFGSEMSLKTKVPYTGSEARYNITSEFVYPHRSVLPVIKRNGFSGHLYGFSPTYLFPIILSDPHAETLFKARQFSLIRSITKTKQYWTSVRICLRNGYMVNDATIWFDYLDLLQYFGKDLRNAKYVCPENLKKEHDRLVVKKRAILEREEIENKRKRAHEMNEKFLAMKSQFVGMKFISDQIMIKTLDSVQEYLEEGDRLHHCVFANDYALKKDSLCLSARINEQPVETIEVDLKKMKIVQCRGIHNNKSEYHDKIIKLMSENIPRIAKIAKTYKMPTQ